MAGTGREREANLGRAPNSVDAEAGRVADLGVRACATQCVAVVRAPGVADFYDGAACSALTPRARGEQVPLLNRAPGCVARDPELAVHHRIPAQVARLALLDQVGRELYDALCCPRKRRRRRGLRADGGRDQKRDNDDPGRLHGGTIA